jgi:YspA, cpYpsA-related SLOG family
VRVIVCGSRDWEDRERVELRLSQLPPSPTTTIVHGAALGPDRIAGSFGSLLGMTVEEHPAEWDRLGKSAGRVRNEKMALLGADLCIAFWDGESKGTKDMIDRCHLHGIPVEIIR